MSINETLRKVDEDINSGDLGKARDRLNGLINTYPNNLELRKKLGEVYWKLHYPEMAGRFWYLEKHKTPEMIKACDIFEKACGKDLFTILRLLKFKGDLTELPNGDAKEILLSLVNQVQDKGHKKVYTTTSKQNNKNSFIHIGCITILLIILGLLAIGIKTVIEWLI